MDIFGRLIIFSVFLVVYLGIWAIFVIICNVIANNKGLPSSYKWFGLLGIIGIIIVAVTPSHYDKNNYPPYNNNNYPPYNNYPNNNIPPYQNNTYNQNPYPQQPKNPNVVNLNKQPKKYCTNCGVLLKSGINFCDNCGRTVD